MAPFSASKTDFLNPSTRRTPSSSHHQFLFFEDAQLFPSCTVNSISSSLIQNINWEFHISCLSNHLPRGQVFCGVSASSLSHGCCPYEGLFALVCRLNLTCGSNPLTKHFSTEWSQRLLVSLTNCLPLIRNLPPLKLCHDAATLGLTVSYRYFHVDSSPQLVK